MSTGKPLITIIIALLNSGKTLEQCLRSVLSQSYTNRELILMDGGSVDGTIPIIKNYENDITCWESSSDDGVYHAWNKALKHANGEWICFLGADDYFWNDSVLETYLPQLKTASASGIRVVYGRVVRIDKMGKMVRLWGKPWKKIRWQMPHGMPLGMPHTGLMHHISPFKYHGLFDDNLKLAGDYEFLLWELKHKDRQALFVNDLIIVGQP